MDATHGKRRRLASVTFAEGFETFFAIREHQLSNGKHVQRGGNTMRDYVPAKIGRLPFLRQQQICAMAQASAIRR
jgi:hypothetical protein